MQNGSWHSRNDNKKADIEEEIEIEEKTSPR